MGFYSILGFALLVTVLLIIIRKERPEMGVMLAIAAASLIFIALLPNLNRVLLVFESLGIKSNQNLEYLKLIVKIIGLAYLAGFGAQICKDAGENSMAGKIELAGKIFILTMGMPIMAGLLDLILKIL
ncbi:MAG: stage III sporulation protein AD [Firmicutes bacterium]|nr:stage III sporulation protein AD [Bacillota bacterium]